ncbi:FAR1-related protein [Trifolium medium]|uniref:FAR1-related protein n=1 Tax=Trifolium medium TaxID=97028 RepID=A0A392MKB3_9FABA|nr:FAR1-related protein [Trifolium medium]
MASVMIRLDMEYTSDKGRKSVRRESVEADAVKKRARNSSVGESTEIFQINRMPNFMHPYIDAITDVKGDEALLPSKRKTMRHGVALMEKWFTFPDMGHVTASILDRVVVNMTKHGDCVTFFPLCGSPPEDPTSHIVCLGSIPGHYFYVKLKDGCSIPPTCPQWRNHCSPEAAAWESYFLDHHTKFHELMKAETGDKKTNITSGFKIDDPVVL